MLEKLLRREPYLDPKKVKKKSRHKQLTKAQKANLDPAFRAKVRYDGMSREEWLKKYPKQADRSYINTLINRSIAKRRQIDVRFKKMQNKYVSSAISKNKHGQSKICTRCDKEYGLWFFELTKDPKKSKSTRKSYCYNCRKKINHENYLKNKEKIKAKNAAYYAANKEKLKQTMKENYARRSGKNIK